MIQEWFRQLRGLFDRDDGILARPGKPSILQAKACMKISCGNRMVASRGQPTETVSIDLVKEDIHFVLLVGAIGAGKSFFHRFVYRELIQNHSPKEVAFLFFDATGKEAREWEHSPYLYHSIVTEPEEGLRVLELIARESAGRQVRVPSIPELVIHIEEDVFVLYDCDRFEKALREILRHRKTNAVYIFYSTSHRDYGLLESWLKTFVDLRIVFKLDTEEEALWLTGETTPVHFVSPGEHLLVFGSERIHCTAHMDTTEIL